MYFSKQADELVVKWKRWVGKKRWVGTQLRPDSADDSLEEFWSRWRESDNSMFRSSSSSWRLGLPWKSAGWKI